MECRKGNCRLISTDARGHILLHQPHGAPCTTMGEGTLIAIYGWMLGRFGRCRVGFYGCQAAQKKSLFGLRPAALRIGLRNMLRPKSIVAAAPLHQKAGTNTSNNGVRALGLLPRLWESGLRCVSTRPGMPSKQVGLMYFGTSVKLSLDMAQGQDHVRFPDTLQPPHTTARLHWCDVQ